MIAMVMIIIVDCIDDDATIADGTDVTTMQVWWLMTKYVRSCCWNLYYWLLIRLLECVRRIQLDSCSVYYIAVLIIAIVLRMKMRIRACLLLLSDAKFFTTPVQIQYGLLMMRVNGFINHVFIYRYFILRVNLAMHWRCILLVWSPTYSRWKNCWHLVILTQKIMWVMNNLGIYR